MPLFIGGKRVEKVPTSIKELVDFCPEIQAGACEFRQKPATAVSGDGLLYVNQREYAVILPHDESVRVVGTDDATTCHVVILRHPGGAVCFSHLDGVETAAAVQRLLAHLLTLGGTGGPGGHDPLDLYIVGGFCDDKRSSLELSLELLREFAGADCELDLKLACVTDLNDVMRNSLHYPAVMGVAYDVATGDLYPATFDDHGPDIDLRSASHFTDHNRHIHCLYDSRHSRLTVGPYQLGAWDGVQAWLDAPDRLLRRYLSTSPDQEPPHFARDVRRALQVISDHGGDASTLFPGGRPRKYRRLAGCWTLDAVTSASTAVPSASCNPAGCWILDTDEAVTSWDHDDAVTSDNTGAAT